MPQIQTYFILDSVSNTVKIGRTKNIKKRLAQLQVGNPFELQVLLTFAGDYESHFHKVFAEYSVRGEWFGYGPRMRHYVASKT